MMFSELLIGLGSLTLACLSFLFGRVYNQSEKVLDQKRVTYTSFLNSCPVPGEAHDPEFVLSPETKRIVGVLTVYGSEDVVKYAGEYFTKFAVVQPDLAGVEEAKHPLFLELLAAYNRMVWAMRNDAMTWSVFAPSRASRKYKPSFLVDGKQ